MSNASFPCQAFNEIVFCFQHSQDILIIKFRTLKIKSTLTSKRHPSFQLKGNRSSASCNKIDHDESLVVMYASSSRKKIWFARFSTTVCSTAPAKLVDLASAPQHCQRVRILHIPLFPIFFNRFASTCSQRSGILLRKTALVLRSHLLPPPCFIIWDVSEWEGTCKSRRIQKNLTWRD